MTGSATKTDTTAPVEATAPAAELASEITYLSDEPRSRTITLKHPFSIGDQEFRSVKVRRITGMEAKAYGAAIAGFWRMMQQGGTTLPPEPLFPGIELPREAYPALDDDDLATLEEAADSFFPDRLRPIMEALNGVLALGLTAASGESEPATSPPSSTSPQANA